MRFHPSISIFLGVIVSLVLYLIVHPLFAYFWFDAVIIIFSYTIGGFIAVFYARKKKIQYALYEGIFITLIIVLLAFSASSLDSAFFIYCVYIILLAISGGMIGLMMDKNYNGFSPLLAIIGGSAIGYTGLMLLTLIIGFNIHPNYFLRVIVFVLGAVSFVIGGFLSTFLAKEKKLQYGIYTGIIITILGLLGHQTSIYNPPIIHGGAILLYIFSAVIGSYLAVVVAKHQKQISNK